MHSQFIIIFLGNVALYYSLIIHLSLLYHPGNGNVFRLLYVSGGRNQSETCAGCIVSLTTATSCSLNCSRLTSLRKVALKAANVFAASYLLR